MPSRVDKYGRVHHPAMSMKGRTRKHKGMTFEPIYRGTKRNINTLLTTHMKDIDGRISDKYYFRIYKHKGQRYTLYKGPEKVSHGGLRHKPTKKGRGETVRLKKQRQEAITRYTSDPVNLSDYERIEYGPHSGKYFDKKSNKIFTEQQLRLLIARQGIKEK